MPTLRKDLRSDLEKAVIKARDLAEQAATAALHALAVDQAQATPVKPLPTRSKTDP